MSYQLNGSDFVVAAQGTQTIEEAAKNMIPIIPKL